MAVVNPLDHLMARQGWELVRYPDDFQWFTITLSLAVLVRGPSSPGEGAPGPLLATEPQVRFAFLHGLAQDAFGLCEAL
jgi:hypothetical protein